MEEKLDIEIDDETLAELRTIAEKESISLVDIVRRFILGSRRKLDRQRI